MESLAATVQDTKIKQSIRSRLQLALQTQKPALMLHELFASVPSLTSTDFFIHSFDFANQSTENFEFWYKHLLELACLHLFDVYGNLKTEFLQVVNVHHYWDALSEKYSQSHLKQHLLYAYCHQFIGRPLTNKANLQSLQQRFQQRMQQLLQPEFRIEDFFKRFNNHEWSRLQEIWRWIQYFAKHCSNQPLQFCQGIRYLYQAILHYVERHNELPLDEDKLTTFSEKLAEEMGLISVEEQPAEKIASLYDTFYRLATKKLQPDTLAGAFKKKETLVDVCAYMATLIAQFFILGVTVQHQEKADINMAFLVKPHETEPHAIRFLQQLTPQAGFIDPPYFESRRFIKKIKSLLKKSLSEHCKPLSVIERIEWLLDARQTLLFWLKDSADRLITLTERSSEALRLLAAIDKQMAHWNKALLSHSLKTHKIVVINR